MTPLNQPTSINYGTHIFLRIIQQQTENTQIFEYLLQKNEIKLTLHVLGSIVTLQPQHIIELLEVIGPDGHGATNARAHVWMLHSPLETSTLAQKSEIAPSQFSFIGQRLRQPDPISRALKKPPPEISPRVGPTEFLI
ncbi:hypothetical protein NPIL_72261 [Nephila pilipes]|uniref:Uncharacterized protein n=1 Tax=Nephila pilipes TaxID=299642 RepID=A0A8X6TGS9_NEPPI|nr:hypothetical protein NPIL_72261 [Nephila pilipes]